MSLSQVYNNLVAVRNKITSALQDRGISGTGSMTLNDCAQLVSQLPYSGGVAVDDTTLQNFMAISGTVFYNSAGVRTTGTMPQAQRTVSGNSVIVSPGYIASTVYTSVPVAGSPVVVGNAVHISSGWVQSASTFLIGSAIAEQYIIPGVADRVISAGAYLQGDQIVVGEPNLTASNIVSGVSIFGVQGSFNPGSAFSGVDVTQSDVKAGISFYNSLGVMQTGTIMPASSYISGGSAVVTSGYLDSQLTLVVGSGMTVTPQLLVSGYTAISSGQVITGTMPEAQISVSANSVTIASGYVSSAVTEVIPSMQEYITLSANLVNIPSGYLSSGVSFYVGSALQAASYTPAVSNQIISSGYYLAGNQTILGDTNLVGSNIVSGVTIFGVAGTHQDIGSNSFDFSQATATDSDILVGKSAYGADGTLVSGTISTVSAVLNGNAVTIPNGYIESDSFQVGTAKSSATYTPSTEDQIISSGCYLTGDQTILGDANLVASNIVSGVTIFNVEGTHQGGTDISDTTAVASDVLAGKYFYAADGSKTQGSIATVTATKAVNVVTVPTGYIASAQSLTVGTSVAAQTITPGTSDQTIAADSYLAGATTVKGDANLIAQNIASGVSIFGVEGTHTGGTSLRAGVLVSDSGTLKVQPLSFDGTVPSDSGALQGLSDSSLLIFETGHEEPDYGGSVIPGSSMDFYKCASVNTGNQTWTGYKAILTDGIYSFEATATTGLTYGSGITPQAGGVYCDGATVAATLYQGDSLNIPGLVFYAPLSSLSAYAVTGQALSGTADAYTTIQGIPCARFNSLAASLSASDSALPHGNSAVSLSCWLNYSVIPNDFSGLLTYGQNDSYGQSIAFPDWSSVLFSGANGLNCLSEVTPSQGTWYHFLSIYDGNGTLTNYINGTQSGSYSSQLNIGSEDIHIASTVVARDVYMAGCRIYNRVLTSAEIAALAAEFTPTV